MPCRSWASSSAGLPRRPAGTRHPPTACFLVGEETLTSLLSDEDRVLEEDMPRRLVVAARSGGRGAELEFVSATEGENLEDRLAYLGEAPDIADEREISFRLLRHYASSVRHQKYHGVDIVTVHVDGPR